MKRRSRPCIYLTLTALALAALSGTPALAARSPEDMTVSGTTKRPLQQLQASRRGVVTRSVVVAYGDLDLAAAQGVETLYVRLRGAARRVCAPRDTRIAELGRDWSQCVDNALDDAVAATGIEKVLAMHSEATGRDVSGTSQLAGAP